MPTGVTNLDNTTWTQVCSGVTALAVYPRDHILVYFGASAPAAGAPGVLLKGRHFVQIDNITALGGGMWARSLGPRGSAVVTTAGGTVSAGVTYPTPTPVAMGGDGLTGLLVPTGIDTAITGWGGGMGPYIPPVAGGGPVLKLNVKILAIGDSTTYGIGGDPTGATDETGAFLYSYPAKLREYLAARGHAALQQTFAGDNSGNITAYRSGSGVPTLTMSVAVSPKTPTLGDKLQRIGSGQSCTFKATVDVDTVEFTLYNASGFGTCQLSVDGTPHSTYVTAAASDSYVKYTVTGLTPGPHLFTFALGSGLVHGPGYLNAWNSAIKSFQVINAGARSWTTTQMAGNANPASPRNAIAVVDPDIVLINAGINDYRQAGTSIATVRANIQAIITAAEASGATVILIVPTPINAYNTSTDAWSQAAVLSLYQGLAAANTNTVLINTPQVLFNAGLSGATNPATYTALNANGHMYDVLHPKTSVYTALANAVGAAVLSIATAKGWIA